MWILVRKGEKDFIQAPKDQRLGEYSGKRMTIRGVQFLNSYCWMDSQGQGGLYKFGGPTKTEMWDEIYEKAVDLLEQNKFNCLGMDSEVGEGIPFIHCLSIAVDKLKGIGTTEWKEQAYKKVEEVSKTLAGNPWCVGVFLGNEILWRAKDEDITRKELEKAHIKYYKTMSAAVRKFLPRSLIFSNKYAASLPGNSWPWMDSKFFHSLLLVAANYCSVVCINEYFSSIEGLDVGEKYRKLREYLESKTGLLCFVLLSETGIQANDYERMLSSGLAGRYQKYTSHEFPQAIDQEARGEHMKVIVESLVQHGILGYFFHSFADHGPYDDFPWYAVWKKYKGYSNWGLYDPWRDKVYVPFLEKLRKANITMMKGEKQ